jgi:hypothetical protein
MKNGGFEQKSMTTDHLTLSLPLRGNDAPRLIDPANKNQ